MSDGGNTNIERDSDLWFDDGNIVFIAQSVAFQVHKSILARHSEVFAGLFVVPQPPRIEAPGHTFDGVPSVQVSDTSYDFRMLIKALYGEIWCANSSLSGLSCSHLPCHSTNDPLCPPTFPLLAALARMSHKYQVPHLLATVTRNLKHIFPSRLDLWDEHHSDDLREHAIEAVNLFRLIDCPEMLVSALYDCCRMPPATVMHGTPRADGTHECLTPEDIELCWDVRAGLAGREANITMRFLSPFRAPPTSTCTRVEECAHNIDYLFEESKGHTTVVGNNPLRDFGGYVEEIAATVCVLCAKVLEKRAESLRQEVWDDLPELMDLNIDGWIEAAAVP